MTARLAVALDTTSVTTAQQWAEAVADQADILKLGLEFYLANGRAGVGDVRRAAPGCGLFLDLKLHDIPATVAGAARAVADLAPDYLTVHAAGGPAMVEAAAAALPGTRIAAVTVLTSIGPDDLATLGLPSAADLVPRWAQVATAAGARIDRHGPAHRQRDGVQTRSQNGTRSGPLRHPYRSDLQARHRTEGIE